MLWLSHEALRYSPPTQAWTPETVALSVFSSTPTHTFHYNLTLTTLPAQSVLIFLGIWPSRGAFFVGKIILHSIRGAQKLLVPPPVPFASLLYVRSFVEKGFPWFSHWGDHSWRSTCGTFSWALSSCFTLCRHQVPLPLVSLGVFFKTIHGNRAFNSFCPLEGNCQYKCSWTFFGMSNSDKERIPTTHSSAPDLSEIASSEYPAFLVKVMAPSKNEKNHASVLVPARVFILDSCPYSKSTI